MDRALSLAAAATCVILIAYKFALVPRLNINWDEFFYLSFVYELGRGELTQVFQGAYTRLFRWLPWVGGNEVEQIVAARILMVALLAVTSLLIWTLSRRWLRGFAAVVPPLVYLTLVPVSVHGGSFRADSMLAPALMGVLCLLAWNPNSTRARIAAGAIAGLAFALTVKAVLFAPLIAALIVLTPYGQVSDERYPSKWARMRDLILVGVSASLVAAACIGLHAAGLPDPLPNAPSALPAESATQFATRTATAALWSTPWFPRGYFFKFYAHWQPFLWALMGAGILFATLRRRLDASALALALLPIVFYRNAFPYFYVVMAAPLAVLAGFAVEGMLGYVTSKQSPRVAALLAMPLFLGLIYQPMAYFGRLWKDTQSIQREIVAGVHDIFPDPVNYIDRCGMISSFRKVNFFMSSWGVQSYQDAGRPVMQDIIDRARPAFVLMNTPILQARSRSNSLLFEPDRDVLNRYYVRYWGPVKVAGSEAVLAPGRDASIELPFDGMYRIESPHPVLISGSLMQPGTEVQLPGKTQLPVSSVDGANDEFRMRAILAIARPPSRPEPAPAQIFTGL